MKENKILITAFDLKYQKEVENEEFYLELLPDRIKFRINFNASEPIDKNDADLGWHREQTNSTMIAKKDAITCIDLTYSQDPEKWGIYISISGCDSDIKFFFEKEIEAIETFRKIEQWLFETI